MDTEAGLFSKGCYAPQMRQGLDEYSHRNGHVIKHQKAISEYRNSDFQISGLEISTRKNIQRFDNTKELQKLAGLELVAVDSFDKYNGKTKISKRGRATQIYLLFEAAISVVGKNEEFKEIHRY